MFLPDIVTFWARTEAAHTCNAVVSTRMMVSCIILAVVEERALKSPLSLKIAFKYIHLIWVKRIQFTRIVLFSLAEPGALGRFRFLAFSVLSVHTVCWFYGVTIIFPSLIVKCTPPVRSRTLNTVEAGAFLGMDPVK